jgi:hypothetical protein
MQRRCGTLPGTSAGPAPSHNHISHDWPATAHRVDGPQRAKVVRQRMTETNSLIAYRVDGRGPRATSGQGRAYSAARDDRDSPDRPAPFANNSPARCKISKPRRRDLTLHSKIAGPSKCSYRSNAPVAAVIRLSRAHKHYTSNNRFAEIRFPCAKSLSIDPRSPLCLCRQSGRQGERDHASDYRGTLIGCKSTLVTKQHPGHSYPINPGSLASGAILTTSDMMVLHRGQGKPLFERSGT